MPRHDDLAIYFHRIKRTPLLTREREQELAKRLLRDNDQAAREEMIVANLRLVIFIAKQYANRGLPLEDLIAEGNIGLIRGIERFNPAMNVRLATCISWWIRQSIRRALLHTARPVHVPAHVIARLARFKSAMERFANETGRAVSLEEVARRLKLKKKETLVLRHALLAQRSGVQEGTNEDFELQERLHDHRFPAPDEVAERSEDTIKLRRLLSECDGRRSMVLREHFGLDSGDAKSLQEIGGQIELTRERIRQIESDALRQLKHRFSENGAPPRAPCRA